MSTTSRETATINKPLPGGQEIQFYDWNDFYVFVQDEWRVKDNLTLTLGLRYETPGNSIASLYPVNDAIVATAGGDPRYGFVPRPERDTNNFQPRVGFNWNPRTEGGGIMGVLTGGDKLVVRGGYARTNDYAFININLNIASAFPFVAAINQPEPAPTRSRCLPGLVFPGGNPNQLARTIVSGDFRSPYCRPVQLRAAARARARPRLARRLRRHAGHRPVPDARRQPPPAVLDRPRVNPAHRASSASGPTRPSRAITRCRRASTSGSPAGFSAGAPLHVEQVHRHGVGDLQPVERRSRRPAGLFDHRRRSGRLHLRSAAPADRQLRLRAAVLPRPDQALVGKLLGGWQLSASFTFQSGAPFTVLNGVRPDRRPGRHRRPGRQRHPAEHQHGPGSVEHDDPRDHRGGRGRLFSTLCGNPTATCPGERVGNVGRNTLRADGIGNVDLGFIKNTRFGRHNLQFRVEMFNATNTRNFGIPDGRVNSTNFLNQWGTNGGARTIWISGRYSF